jgi:hypothetical protein
MGGGQGQSKIGQESDRAIADISLQLYNMTKGLRADVIGQITEGLRTGTIQDRTGEITQLVEKSATGGAVSTQQLLDAAATAGQSRTPFAQRQIAAARLQGEQQARLVPADYIQAFIRAGEPILYGQAPALALEGLGGLADISAWQNAQNIAGQGQLIGAGIQAAGQTAASGLVYGAGAAAPPQQPQQAPSTPLYGARQ